MKKTSSASIDKKHFFSASAITTNALMSRRRFLANMALLPLLPSLAGANTPLKSTSFINTGTTASGVADSAGSEYFINGHHDKAGRFYISSFDVGGNERFRLPLPQMPHSFAVDPVNSHRVVSLPGLPGTQAVVMDIATGKKLTQFTSRPGRHFNGHGVFSADGKLLFSSENIVKNSAGVITVRETEHFRFLRELPGHGLGPHDIRMMPDGKTLVLASGGLLTHPDTGKYYLNLNQMKTALLFIDSDDGKLLMRREIPVDKLSIRHLDVSADGTVLVACQYVGRRNMPKLVGVQRGDGDIEMLDIDEDTLWLMNNYTASAVVAGNVAVVSCPRGNQLTCWDLQQKKLIKSIEINDVGGVQVSADKRSFIASANIGELYRIDAKSLKVTPLDNVWQNVKWTNHMVATVT